MGNEVSLVHLRINIWIGTHARTPALEQFKLHTKAPRLSSWRPRPPTSNIRSAAHSTDSFHSYPQPVRNGIQTHERLKNKTKNAVYQDKTQHANFRGNSLYQATKRHLNNSKRKKEKEKKKKKKKMRWRDKPLIFSCLVQRQSTYLFLTCPEINHLSFLVLSSDPSHF